MDIWDVFTGTLQRTLQGHSDQVCSVAFSLDNLQLVSGSADKSIRIWDIESGTCTHILKGHEDVVTSVKFLYNGAQIVSGSLDGTVQLWDASAGNNTTTCTKHSDKVYSVALSSDGIHLASASGNTTIQIWDLVNCKHLKILEGHLKAVYTVVFSPTDDIIASASHDGFVRLWDVVNGVTVNMLKLALVHHSLGHIKFSQDQQYITLGSHCLPTALPILAAGDTVDMQQFPAYYIDSGWVLSMNSQHRICWIPPADRGLVVSTENGVAINASSGIIILNFTSVNTEM